MNLSLRRIGQSIGKFITGGSGYSGSSLWSWSIPGEWKKEDLIKQYLGIVYTVVTAIAEDAAKIDFVIQKGDTPVVNHPFLDLMARPNPDYSQFQFLEMHFTFMKLMGESYWYVANGNLTLKPKEIYLIRPDVMQVVVDGESTTGEVKGYVMSKPDGTKVPFDKEEILHFKLPNPSNPYYGLGPVQAAKVYIQTENYASDWTRNSIYNSGRPSGIVNIKGTIDPESYKELKRQFKEQYSGINNAGKTMFTKGADGIDFQKIGMELQEVALRELKEMTRDDIMMMFRVSKTMLGISEGVTLNNARESREMFRESITMAEWDRLNDHLNAFLLPRWGTGALLTYKKNVYKTVEQSLAEDMAAVDKWMTKDEVRQKNGLEPLPNGVGSVIYQPLTLVPMTQSPEEQQAERDQRAEDAAAAAEAANNNAGDNSGGDNGNSNDNANSENDNTGKSVKKKELRKQKADIFKRIFFDTQSLWEKKYQQFMVKEFNIQEKQILSQNKKDALHNWHFDVDASSARIKGHLIPLGEELMKASALLALEMADDSDTEFQITQKIREYLFDRIGRLATTTNDETIKVIEHTIGEGISQGESVGKLRNRIKEVYNVATSSRADRIARTESLAASNEGALAAYYQSPLVNAKEWSAEQDACEFCMSFDGTVIGLDEDFAKLGQGVSGDDGGRLQTNYESIEHPPLHPNCRCALLPVAG